MSDAISKANQEDRQIARVEETALELVEALKDTGDKIFCVVNPAAIRYANDILKEAKVRLVSEERIEKV